MAKEVCWYLRNGKYPDERITRDRHREEYVIGDWSWNLQNRSRSEYIEECMKRDLSQHNVKDVATNPAPSKPA